MLKYPKIPGVQGFQHKRCTAFAKLDGTNIGVDWTRDRGFHGFRLRSREIDETDRDFGLALRVFHTNAAVKLTALIEEDGWAEPVSVFGEFHGPRTFAGNHRDLSMVEEAERTFTTFDIHVEGYGFLGPSEFVARARHVGLAIPAVLYSGTFSGQLVEDIRKGKYPVAEGVVLKAGLGGSDLEYAKVKTDAYLAKLKAKFGESWADYWE